MRTTTRTTEPTPREQYLLSRRDELDRYFPIYRNFKDGAEVSAWVAALREGNRPGTHVVDQLNAAGWDIFDVALAGCDYTSRLPAMGYSNPSRALDYGRSPVVTLRNKRAGKPGELNASCVVTITSKESSLFLGRYGEREARVMLSHEKGAPSQMLIKRA